MRYIAFLRGINVSGQKLIKMEDLRGYFKLPGFKNIGTYIQSGNVLFDHDETDEAMLCKKIEAQLRRKTGHEVIAVLRTLDELKHVIGRYPFEQQNTDDDRKRYVTFLSAPPIDSLKNVLDAYANEKEDLRLINREVYILTTSYGDTKFSNTFIEKKLKVAATTRNWATVNKVLEL